MCAQHTAQIDLYFLALYEVVPTFLRLVLVKHRFLGILYPLVPNDTSISNPLYI